MLFGRSFHNFGLFRKFEIGPKIIKNHRLTPLVSGENFRPQNVSQILV